MRNLTSLFWGNLENSYVRILLGTMKPTLPRKKIILHYVVTNKFGKYNKIIQKQINESMVEKVNETKTFEKRKEFYLPHRPVIRESAETPKIKIAWMNAWKPVSLRKIHCMIFLQDHVLDPSCCVGI